MNPINQTGRIVEWRKDRGYGFVESDGRRVFLHRRDFAELLKAPEAGDNVSFIVGADEQGRPCATAARHLHHGGRLTGARWMALVALCVAPGIALAQVANTIDYRILLGAALGINLLTLLAYWEDKRRAKMAGWRIPESTLHLMELLGGWPAAFLAQGWLRHKSTKLSFQVVFWLIVALHEYAAIDWLLGGRILRATYDAVLGLF